MSVRADGAVRPEGRRRALAYALALHALLVLVLLGGLDVTRRSPGRPGPSGEVIQAEAVDMQAVEREAQRLADAETARKAREAQQAREAEAAEERIAALKRQQEEEAQRAAAAERKRAEQERAAAEAARKAEAERKAAEQARLQAEAERKAAAEAARKAEAQRKAEAARKAEAERRAEQARKAEEAAKAEQARRAAQAEAARKAAEAEAARRQAAAAAAAQGTAQSEIDGYIAAIQRHVGARWIKPQGWPPGATCEVAVKLIPGGEVMQAEVLSCTDPAYAQSVEAAVLRASPLPVPEDTALFNRNFRNFNFRFKGDAS